MKLLENKTFNLGQFQVLAGGIMVGSLWGLVSAQLTSLTIPIVGEGVLIGIILLQMIKLRKSLKDSTIRDTVTSRINQVWEDKKQPGKYWVKTEDNVKFHVYDDLSYCKEGEWYCQYFKRTKIPYMIGTAEEVR